MYLDWHTLNSYICHPAPTSEAQGTSWKKGSEVSNNQRTKKSFVVVVDKHLKSLIFMLDPSPDFCSFLRSPSVPFQASPTCHPAFLPLSLFQFFSFPFKVTKKSSVRSCLLEMVGKIHPCYLSHLDA